jgi:hypothetical protein
MLYRCAEITLQNGKDYFVVVNKDVDKNTKYETYGRTLAWGWSGGWTWRHGYFPPTGYIEGSSYARPIANYEVIADIVLYSGPKPKDSVDAYDAREVLKAIGPTVIQILPAQGTPIAFAHANPAAG